MKYKIGQRVDYTISDFFGEYYYSSSSEIVEVLEPNNYFLKNGKFVKEEEILGLASVPPLIKSGKLLW